MLTPDPLRQIAGLRRLGHRPFRLPRRPWLMGQTWRDLLFAHWRVEPERLRPLVPAEIPLDVFDGSCWVGVTPFEITGLWAGPVPPLPWLSRFAEINVRTYTTIGGRPGIWFLSLDAASRPAVAAARAAYRLPYFPADATIRREGAGIAYQSRRSSAADIGFAARYAPRGPVRHAAPGSLEHFVSERYCLYSLDDEHRVHRGDIHHPRWPLQDAEAEIERNTMAAPYGLELEGDPVLHMARRNDVLIWSLRAVRGSSA